MTANLKNFDATRKCAAALKTQIDAEFKVDPRFKRSAARAASIIRILDIMQERYELVHSRKIPAKVAAKKTAKAGAKKAAPKKAAKKASSHAASAAAARRRVDVRRSK